MKRVKRRTWIINGALAALLMVIGLIALGSLGGRGDEAEEIRTVPVTRGSVVATVSASGELIAPTDVVLDFAIGGRVVEVLVEPGDKVAAGDVLARLDDEDALDQQEAAEAGLMAAQAALDRVINRLTPAQRSLGSAQLAAAAEQVRAASVALTRAAQVAAANAALYDEQVKAAQDQLAIQKANRDGQVAAARANLAAADANLDRLVEGQTKAQLEVGDAQISVSKGAVKAAEVALSETRNVAEANEDAYDLQVESAESSLAAAQDRLLEAQDRLAELQEDAAACDRDQNPDLCAQLDAAVQQQAAVVDQFDLAVGQAESSLTAALAAQTQGQARNEQAIALAKSQLDQAERALDLTRAQVAAGREDPTQAEVAAAESQVLLAQAQLNQALRAVDESPVDLARASRNTGRARDTQATEAVKSQLEQSRRSLEITRAQVEVNEEPPSDAEIAAATAQVRQAEAALNQATRLAEETVMRAPVAGTVATVTAEVGEYVIGGATPGGLGFLRLTDVNDLMIEVQFSEADAVRMKVGRSAAIEVNASPEELLTGQVVRINPTATVVSDLVTYGVRVALTSDPGDVRPGQTVTVDVIIDEVDDVLFVPTSALERIGDETYVTVVDELGTPSQRPVRPGLQGDGTTQILAGLQEGEEVAMVGGGYVPAASLIGG